MNIGFNQTHLYDTAFWEDGVGEGLVTLNIKVWQKYWFSLIISEYDDDFRYVVLKIISNKISCWQFFFHLQICLRQHLRRQQGKQIKTKTNNKQKWWRQRKAVVVEVVVVVVVARAWRVCVYI